MRKFSFEVFSLFFMFFVEKMKKNTNQIWHKTFKTTKNQNLRRRGARSIRVVFVLTASEKDRGADDERGQKDFAPEHVDLFGDFFLLTIFCWVIEFWKNDSNYILILCSKFLKVIYKRKKLKFIFNLFEKYNKRKI